MSIDHRRILGSDPAFTIDETGRIVAHEMYTGMRKAVNAAVVVR